MGGEEAEAPLLAGDASQHLHPGLSRAPTPTLMLKMVLCLLHVLEGKQPQSPRGDCAVTQRPVNIAHDPQEPRGHSAGY